MKNVSASSEPRVQRECSPSGVFFGGTRRARFRVLVQVLVRYE